ncbi:MAG TPA: acyltransferase family protein [Methylotenera sp.]|nr:acyltransferase family protein [Methylotenera sp.]
MKYRREIDGLRAIAVLPVLLFHAGFQSFSGGYIGVDIFFVISGYLITSIIINDLHAGTFSLLKFYERRARRILPALFLVMLVSLPFAWWWMSPTGLYDFSKSLIAVSLFLSNILFWKEAGYFATANELKPLLHTWSLAVEEQYYVLFPLFLMLAWRFIGKRWIVGMLFVGALASLAASEWALTRFSSASFYLLPTRGWELLIGALAAFFLFSKADTVNKPSQLPFIVSQAASLLGLLLITYAVFVYDKFTLFPGLNALVPTIGTVMIILFANPLTYVGKILGSKLLVGIGLISYSAYLWHQPLFSFARYGSIEEPSKILFLLLIVISLLLAFLSWKFVETPFRNKNIVRRNQIFWFGLIGSLFFISVGLVGVANKGFEIRYNMPASLSSSFGLTQRADECFDKPNLAANKDWLCDIGVKPRAAKEKPAFVVFGDSHSKSLFDAFNEAALQANAHGVYSGMSYCAPLLGIYILHADQAQACHLVNQRVFDYVKANQIKKIFLVGRWSAYTDGGYDGTEITWIGTTQGGKKAKAPAQKAFEAGLKQTVAAYTSIGTQLYIVEQVPQQTLAVKDLYYKIYASKNDQKKVSESIRELSVSKQQHLQLQAFANALFKQHVQAGQLSLINFDDIFCDIEKCLIGTDEYSYYFDNNHLTTAGGHMVVDKLIENIN